ncbi:DUF4192 domain-containing protein [Nocardia vinacea]|uniref:DUF4192 domain-containing protein n=1 Tax=Nocardia vinacea TaxID=96468 RepID=UPI002E10233A|nr:DUF4192 domain-containing protein [Nocardia vinacea]
MPSIEDPGAFLAGVLSQLPRPAHRIVLILPVKTSDAGFDADFYVDAVRGVALYSTGADLGLVDENIATRPILAHTLDACRLHNPAALAVVIVDDPRPHRPVPRNAHHELIALMREQLVEQDIELLDAWTLTGFAPGQRWTSLFDNDTGVLPSAGKLEPVWIRAHSPASDPIPAVLVSDPALAVAVNRALKSLNETRNAAEAAGRTQQQSPRELLRLVLDQIQAADSGTDIAALDIARVEVAMHDETVRRSLYALSSSPRGTATQALWTLLVRALPSPRRAHAALQLAVSAYISNDLDMVLAALRIALTDDPTEPTGRQLADDVALSVPATVIGEQLRSGYLTAAALGIDLDQY